MFLNEVMNLDNLFYSRSGYVRGIYYYTVRLGEIENYNK